MIKGTKRDRRDKGGFWSFVSSGTSGSSVSLQRGFTLIELLIVFSLITILSSIGVASFVNYSRSQSIQATIDDIKTTLFTARSRAISQLKTNTCGASNLQLQGYEVIFCCSGAICNASCYPDSTGKTPSYEMNIVCSDPSANGLTHEVVYSKTFSDPNISYATSPNTTANSYFFSVITAAVSTNAANGATPKLTISGYGITKSFTVSATGVIQ